MTETSNIKQIFQIITFLNVSFYIGAKISNIILHLELSDTLKNG